MQRIVISRKEVIVRTWRCYRKTEKLCLEQTGRQGGLGYFARFSFQMQAARSDVTLLAKTIAVTVNIERLLQPDGKRLCGPRIFRSKQAMEMRRIWKWDGYGNEKYMEIRFFQNDWCEKAQTFYTLVWEAVFVFVV